MEIKKMKEEEKVTELFEAYKREGQAGIKAVLERRNEEYRAELAGTQTGENLPSEEASTTETPQGESLTSMLARLSKESPNGSKFVDLSGLGLITQMFKSSSEKPKDPSQD